MVTTRGGTETPGVPTPTPRSSARKTAGKRELESLDTPTQAKRSKKSASAPTPKKKATKETQQPDPRAEGPSQESIEVASNTITVAPLSTKTPQTPEKEDLLPIRWRSSPKVVVAKTSPPTSSATASVESGGPAHDNDFHTPMQQPGSVYATPATHMRPQGSPTPRAKTSKDQTSAAMVAKKGKGRQKKTPKKEEPAKFDEVPSSTYESDTAPISSQDLIPTSAQPQKTHMRFGSEEPTEAQDSPVVNSQAESDVVSAHADEDDASDSDEAPEMVTTATATSKALAARAEADRAQKAQQAKEQAKRQAREGLIAAQQAAKREREEKKAKKLAKKAAKEQKAAAVPDDEEPEVESRMDVDVRNLPLLLPDSLLDTIDDQRPPTPPPERRGKTEEELRKEKLNHHIKFLERMDQSAKDVKKGKLSIAVLGQHNRVLPPKVNRNTKNVREHWLKGRRVEKKKGGKPNFGFGRKMERRPHGSRGFLRNGDD